MDLGFCLVPRVVSPLNRVANVKQSGTQLDLGLQVRTKYSPIRWMVLATIFAVFGVAEPDAALAGKSLPRLRTLLLGAVPGGASLTALYETARPVYELVEPHNKRVVARAQTGFTASRHLFRVVVQDLVANDACSGGFDADGTLRVEWHGQSFRFAPLPRAEAVHFQAAGYEIKVSASKFNLLQVRASASLHLTPLNVFHSRVFCARPLSSTQTRLPATMLLLLFYFWEHNGAVSLLQLASGAAFAHFFASTYHRVQGAQPTLQGPGETDEEVLWRGLIRGGPDFQQVRAWYRLRHPRTPIPKLAEEQRRVLQEANVCSLRDLSTLFHKTYDALHVDSTCCKTKAEAVLRDWRTLTGRKDFMPVVDPKAGKSWLDKLFGLANCVGDEKLGTPQKLWNLATCVQTLASAPGPPSTGYKWRLDDPWLLTAFWRERYRSLTGTDFPLSDVLRDMEILHATTLYPDDVTEAYITRIDNEIRASLQTDEPKFAVYKQLRDAWRRLSCVHPADCKKDPLHSEACAYIAKFPYSSAGPPPGWMRWKESEINLWKNYYRIMQNRLEVDDETNSTLALRGPNPPPYAPSCAELTDEELKTRAGKVLCPFGRASPC